MAAPAASRIGGNARPNPPHPTVNRLHRHPGSSEFGVLAGLGLSGSGLWECPARKLPVSDNQCPRTKPRGKVNQTACPVSKYFRSLLKFDLLLHWAAGLAGQSGQCWPPPPQKKSAGQKYQTNAKKDRFDSPHRRPIQKEFGRARWYCLADFALSFRGCTLPWPPPQ